MIKSVSEEVQRQTGWFSNKRQQPLVAVMDKVETNFPLYCLNSMFKIYIFKKDFHIFSADKEYIPYMKLE